MRLLVNNGTIGAFAYSLGFPTLYIKHSPYQSWHSSHCNAVAIPPIYASSGSSSLDLLQSLELSFSTPSILPYEFEAIYSSRGISLVPLTKYPPSIFSESINQACKLNSSFQLQYSSNSFPDHPDNLDIDIQFWSSFNRLAPKRVRLWHRKNYLAISSSFLKNCSFD